MSGRLDPEPMPRRDFLGLAGLWAAGTAIFGSIIGMARLPVPNVLPEASQRFRIGEVQVFQLVLARCAGIAGRNDDLLQAGRLRQAPGHGVLAAAGTDYQ